MAALLGLEPDLEIVAHVDRGDDVLPAVRAQPIDVALLDIEMPGLDGIAVVEQLQEHAPQVRTLIVTTFGRPGYLRRGLDAGASGFLVKDTPADELADAVRRIHSGVRVVDPSLATESLLDGMNPLTEREQQVLTEALTGAPVADIARSLSLSVGTVRNYLSTAATKTHAQSSVQAAVIARDRGWL
ncbi:UNVERIFIED_CONTAM: hypothetical protein GTU68_000777 [Idotea baltica]|nr:hypothetical protein [Idotea baltica]